MSPLLFWGIVLLAVGGFCLLVWRWPGLKDEVEDMREAIHQIDRRPLRPLRPLPDPVVAKLQLTKAQRQTILRCYDEQYTKACVWPDIKLQAFIDMLLAKPNGEVTVFFAQKRILNDFAAEHQLDWLSDMLKPQNAVRSMTPLPEDVA